MVVTGAVISIIIVLVFRLFLFDNDKSSGFKTLNLIPGVWTSLGILGTFYVLYQNLNEIHIEPNMDLTPTIQELANAFSTSLIGISLSVISNVAIRIYTSFLENKTASENWKGESPEKLLYDLLQVNKGMEEGLSNKIGTLVNNQTDLLEKVSGQISNMAQETIGAVKEVSKKVSSDSEEKTSAMLLNINSVLTNIQGSLIEAVKNVTEKVSEKNEETTSNMLTSIETTLSNIEKGLNNTLTSSLSLTQEGLTKSLEALQKQAMKAQGSEITEIGKQFAKSVESLSTLMNNEMKHMKVGFDTSITDSIKTNAELQKTLKENTIGASDALKENLGELSEVLDSKISVMVNKMEALNTQVEGNTKSSIELNNTLQTKIDNIAIESSKKLKENIDTMMGEVKALKIQVSEDTKKSIDTGKSIQTEINDTALEASKKLEENLDKIAGLYENSIVKVIEDNTSKLEASFGRIDKWQNTNKLALEMATKEFTKAVNGYKDIEDQQGEVVSLIKVQLEKMGSLIDNKEVIYNLLDTYSSKNQQYDDLLQAMLVMIDKKSEELRLLKENIYV